MYEDMEYQTSVAVLLFSRAVYSLYLLFLIMRVIVAFVFLLLRDESKKTKRE